MEFDVSGSTYAEFIVKMGLDPKLKVDNRRRYMVELDDDLGIKSEQELLKAMESMQ